MNRRQKLLTAYADTVLTREVKVSSRAAYKLGGWCKGQVTPKGCEAWVEWLQTTYTGAVKEKDLFLTIFVEYNCLNQDLQDLGRIEQPKEPVPVQEVARRMGLKSIKSLERLL
jgi:hypothetical protein